MLKRHRLRAVSFAEESMMGIFDKLFGKNNAEKRAQRQWDYMWQRWAEGALPSPYQELLTYDSEVQDGGHLQFFLNMELRKSNMFALMAQLKEILPEGHAGNLSAAYRAYCRLGVDVNDDASIAEALDEAPLRTYDSYYAEHEEEMLDLLEAYAATL